MIVKAAGFTLIEMLVALAILAVIAGVLMLSTASGGNEPRLRLEAERLQARMNLACERAELTGRDIGLHFGSDIYGFSQRRGELMELQTKAPLGPYKLPKDMLLEVPEIELAAGLPDKPQMICFSSGERTPIAVSIGAGSGDPRYRVLVEAIGNGRIQRRPSGAADWQDWAARR